MDLPNTEGGQKIRFNKHWDEGIVGKLLYSVGTCRISLIRNQFNRLCWHLLGAHYQFYSATLRQVLKDRYNVKVGKYSHGACCLPGRFPNGTVFGRYCSIAKTATSLNANHPTNTKSSHAFFFNPTLGYCAEQTIPRTQLKVGNDVWIGEHAIILSSCTEIGDGAVIGAGAVVSKNVPRYGIVVGNPGRLVRYRFSQERINELVSEQWWEKEITELAGEQNCFTQPVLIDDSLQPVIKAQ